MHLKGKYSWLKHIDFILIDLLSLAVSFSAAFHLKFGNRTLNSDWKSIQLIIVLIQIVINLLLNPYSGLLRRRYYEEVIRGLQMAAYNLVATTLLLFALKSGDGFSREVMFETFGMYLCLSLALKYVWKRLLISGKIKFGQNKLRTLAIVSDRESLDQTLRDATAADFQEYDIRAVCLADGTTASVQYPTVELDELEGFVLKNRIDEVLVATDTKRIQRGFVETLLAKDIKVHVNVEGLFDLKPDDQYISRIGIIKSLTLSQFDFLPKQYVYLGIKRVLDVLIGAVGCVFLLPLMGVVKIMNLASGDHGPLFFRQKRIGKDGKEIRIFKFRSMVPNAEEVLREMLKDPKYAAEWARDQKFENDPRITKAGNILRKTSLDEWSQFINVVKGDMSVIGPRPLVPGELEEHGGLQLYNKVRPGITGWWGCNGRSNIEYKERLDLEYHYIKHIGINIDVICFLRTVGAVLGKSGAK